MNSNRKAAVVVGALYIIALSAAMLRSVLLDSILDAPGYLVHLSSNEGDVLLGVILLFIMGVAIPSIGIVFYPIFYLNKIKRYRLVMWLQGSLSAFFS